MKDISAYEVASIKNKFILITKVFLVIGVVAGFGQVVSLNRVVLRNLLAAASTVLISLKCSCLCLSSTISDFLNNI